MEHPVFPISTKPDKNIRRYENGDVFEGLLLLDAYDAARQAAPGWDTRHLENEWRRWCGKEEIEPKHPTKHYVKFCESWFEKRGRP
jgi:hypothetical protein